MAQRAFSYNRLQQLCIDGVPVTVRRGETVRHVFKIAGSSPEGNEGDDDDDPDKDKGSEGGTSEGSSGEDKDKGSEGSTETVTREEFEALSRRMKAADKRASDAETKVKEYEAKTQTDLEKAQARAAELEAENSTLQKGNREAQVRNAFLADNSVTWHDPDLAFREVLVSLGEDVEVDEKGKVPGLKEKVKALAKEKAWMVKTEAPSGASGSDQNGKRKGEEDKKDKEALKAVYPALRR